MTHIISWQQALFFRGKEPGIHTTIKTNREGYSSNYYLYILLFEGHYGIFSSFNNRSTLEHHITLASQSAVKSYLVENNLPTQEWETYLPRWIDEKKLATMHQKMGENSEH